MNYLLSLGKSTSRKDFNNIYSWKIKNQFIYIGEVLHSWFLEILETADNDTLSLMYNTTFCSLRACKLLYLLDYIFIIISNQTINYVLLLVLRPIFVTDLDIYDLLTKKHHLSSYFGKYYFVFNTFRISIVVEFKIHLFYTRSLFLFLVRCILRTVENVIFKLINSTTFFSFR